MPIPALSLLDWLAIAAFLLFCIVVGLAVARQVRDAGAFLLANRSLGKLLTMSTGFAGSINANDPVIVAGATWRTGISGIWVALHLVLLMPWYWLVAPLGRRVRCVTVADMVRMRMGRPVEYIYLTVSILATAFSMGVGIKAAVAATMIISGGTISHDLALALIVLPTLAYCLLGGLRAVAITDLAMSALILLLSFLLIPFALSAIGGVAALAPPAVPASHYDMLGGQVGGGQRFTLVTIACMVAGSLVAVGGVTPAYARNEIAARFSVFSGPIKRFCTLGWATVGIAAVVVLAGVGATGVAQDEVFARMSGILLPDGLRGLMIASIFAAVMSTIAGSMLGGAGVLVNNVYRQHLRPDAPAAEYLLVARLGSAAMLIAGVAVMLAVDQDFVTFSLNVFSLLGVFGLPLLTLFIWRRVTAAGCIAGVVVGGTMFVCGNMLKVSQSPDWYVGLASGLCSLWHYLGQVSVVLPSTTAPLAEQVFPIEVRTPLLLLPSLAAIVIVSWFTRQHDARIVAEFYARLDTPVGEEHTLAARGIQPDLIDRIGGHVAEDPSNHDVQRRMLVLDLLQLPRLLWRREVSWWDYRIDLLGILISVVFIAAFVGLITLMISAVTSP